MHSRPEHTRNFTSRLAVVLDYPIDLDLESLEGNTSQRNLTAAAQEGTCRQCPFGGARGYILFVVVIDIVPDVGRSRSHWHRKGSPLTLG